jgi:transcriptional regulator with XRE-family HTH domain
MDIPEQHRFVISQIRKLRGQKGISQMELAVKSGMSQSFLASLEKGKKSPSVLTILKIADALEISPKDFFPERPCPEAKQRIKEQIISLLEYF